MYIVDMMRTATTGWCSSMKIKKGDKAVRELGITTVVGFLFYFAAIFTGTLKIAACGLVAVSCVAFMYFIKAVWNDIT